MEIDRAESVFNQAPTKPRNFPPRNFSRGSNASCVAGAYRFVKGAAGGRMGKEANTRGRERVVRGPLPRALSVDQSTGNEYEYLRYALRLQSDRRRGATRGTQALRCATLVRARARARACVCASI